MTAAKTAFREITEAGLIPRIVRLRDNLFGAVFSLMKLVPARYILRRALDVGQLDEDTLIVETTSGTFGLALAMQAALLERRLILVSDPVIDVNLHRRLVDLGAEVDIVRDPALVGGYQGSRLARLAEIRQRNANSFCPEQYSNPDNPRSYALVAAVLLETLGQVDCLVGPVGSGGSMCGTASYLRTVVPEAVVIGVDTHHSVLFGQPDGLRTLRGLGNSLQPANLDHSQFDDVHWCNAAEAYAATRRLHRQHALFQGPTSGAAFLVAEWYAARNPDATCVVMLPDEGYRYQASVYDDAWLAENGFDLSTWPVEPVELTHPAVHTGGWSRFPWDRRRLSEVLSSLGTAVAHD
ncbi:MAG: pyridoxal-phosphate dependent enzyme [Actinomycetota bacterium]|nr:pyridoxal-phosphate dependent enzyme [Actinomycetota bacterium]